MAPTRWRSRLLKSLTSSPACYTKCALEAGLLFATAALAGQVAGGATLAGSAVWDHVDALVAAVVGAGLLLDAAAGVPLGDASPLDALMLAASISSACVGTFASGWAALVPGRACLLQIAWAGLLGSVLEGALGFRAEALQAVAAAADAAASAKALTPRGSHLLHRRRSDIAGGDATPPPPLTADVTAGGSPSRGAGSRRRTSLSTTLPSPSGGALASPRHGRPSSSFSSPASLPALLPSMGAEVRSALTLLLRCLVVLLLVVPAVLRACVDAAGLAPSSAGLIATAVIVTLAAAATLAVLRARLHARVIAPLHRLAAFIHLLGQGGQQGAQTDATAVSAANDAAHAQARGAGPVAGSDVEKGSAESGSSGSGGSSGRGQQRSLWVSLFRKRRAPAAAPSGGSVAAGSADASHEGPAAVGDAVTAVGCTGGGAACVPPSFGAFPSPFAAATWAPDAGAATTAEVELLRHYFRRMWRLVQLGFGEAGHAIVARYISSDDATAAGGALGHDGLPLLLPQLSGGGGAAGRRASFGNVVAAGRPPSARRRPQQPPSSMSPAGLTGDGGGNSATRGALRHSTAFPRHAVDADPQRTAAPPVDTTASIVGIAPQPPPTSVTTDGGRGDGGGGGTSGGLQPLHTGGFSPSEPAGLVPRPLSATRGPPLRFDSVLDAPSLLAAGAVAAAGGGDGGAGGLLRGLRGEKVHAVFMFADLFNFTAITEALQEDVLAFVNEVARIVHAEVDAGGGAPNKNIGDAFLCTWKLPDAPLRNAVKTRRRSGGASGALGAAALAAGGASLPSTGSSGGGGGWTGAGLLRSLRRGSFAFNSGAGASGSSSGGTPHHPALAAPHGGGGGLVGAPDLALTDAAASPTSSAPLPSAGSAASAAGAGVTKRRSSRLSLALASPGSVLTTFFRHGRAGSTASASSAGGGGGGGGDSNSSSVGGSPVLGALGGGTPPQLPTVPAAPLDAANSGSVGRAAHDISDDPMALRASVASDGGAGDSASPPAQHSRDGIGSPDAASGTGGGGGHVSLYVSPALAPLRHAGGLTLPPLPSITEVSHSTETPVVVAAAGVAAGGVPAAATHYRRSDGSGDNVPTSVAVATDASLHLSLSPGALSSPLPSGRAHRSLSLPSATGGGGAARHAVGSAVGTSGGYISAVSTADGRSGTLTAPLSTMHATPVGGQFVLGGAGSSGGALSRVAESATGMSNTGSSGSSGGSSPRDAVEGAVATGPLMAAALPLRSPATPPHVSTAGPPLLLPAGSPPLSFRGPFPLPTNASGVALQMSPRLRAYSSSFGGGGGGGGGGGEQGLMLPVGSPPHGAGGGVGAASTDLLAEPGAAGSLLSGGFPHVLEPLEDEDDGGNAAPAAMSPNSSQSTQNAASTYGGRGGGGHAGGGSSRPPLPAAFQVHFPAASGGVDSAGSGSGDSSSRGSAGEAAASLSSSAPSSPTAVQQSRRQQPRRFATAAGAALAAVSSDGDASDASGGDGGGQHAHHRFHLSHSVSETSLAGGAATESAAVTAFSGTSGGDGRSNDSVATVASSRYMLSVSGGNSRPSTAPAAMPHNGAEPLVPADDASSDAAPAVSLAECYADSGRDTRSTVASEPPQQVHLSSRAPSSSTASTTSRAAADDGYADFSRGSASRHSASSITATEAGAEGALTSSSAASTAAPAPALLPLSPLGQQLGDTVSPLSSGGVPTPSAAAASAGVTAMLRRGNSGESTSGEDYSGVTSVASGSGSPGGGGSGSAESSSSAAGAGAPLQRSAGAASHAPSLPSVLSSSSMASSSTGGSGAYSTVTGDLGSYASSGEVAAGGSAAAGASGTGGSVFSGGSSAEAGGGAPTLTVSSHSVPPPLMVAVPSVGSLVTYGGAGGGGASSSGSHGLPRPPPVPVEPASHAASRRASRLGSLGTPCLLAPLTTSGLPSPALASAHSAHNRRDSLALPPPAPHPASGAGAGLPPPPSTTSLPLASALGPSRRASFGFGGGGGAVGGVVVLPPALAPLSAPAGTTASGYTPPFPLLSSPAAAAAVSPHLSAHSLQPSHAHAHPSHHQHPQQLALRSRYRRASSAVSLYAQPGLNPYTQRADISRVADNALAGAVNIALRVHASNLPGGSLYPYLVSDRLVSAAAAAGRAASAATSGGGVPSTPAFHSANAAGGGAPAPFRLGLGLHIGWAIEGAIGSSLKMDATYLSPSVNITARLESATRAYGVDVLVSQAFAECLSEPAQGLLRLIDRVQLKGVGAPFHVYTIDWDADAGLALLEGRAAAAAAAAAAGDGGGGDGGDADGTPHSRTQRRRRRLSDFDGYDGGGAGGGGVDDDEFYVGGVRYRAIGGSGDGAGDSDDDSSDDDDADVDGELSPAGDGDAVAVNVAGSGGGAPATLSPQSGGSDAPHNRHLRTTSQRAARLHSQHSHRRAAGGVGGGGPTGPHRRRRRRSATVADLAALQPAAAFPPDFFEHAELAVSFYLGDPYCDWPRARAHAEAALALRPGDGPLRSLLAFTAECGVGPSKAAPPWWRGFRSLESK
jgi:hypothetical protein